MMTDNRILQTILDRLTALESRVNQGFKDVKERFDRVDERIDKLGLQIAHLEDDAPTVAEFDGLEKRVDKLEKQFASA